MQSSETSLCRFLRDYCATSRYVDDLTMHDPRINYPNKLKGALSGLAQFLAAESPLKVLKNPSKHLLFFKMS